VVHGRGAYEVRSDSAAIKYYSFGGQTVAMHDPSAGFRQAQPASSGQAGLQYFVTDHPGSIVAVTDASGTLTSQQRYLPFGGVRPNVPSPNAPATDFGYTGQRNLDSGIGLMDYEARFYSPYNNRFIQPDSIVPNPSNPQSLNRFSYVYNNPVRFNDPTGHMCTDPEDLWSPGCDGANTVGEKPHGGGLGNLGSGNSNSSSGGSSNSSGGGGNSGSPGGTSNNSGCGHHHCPDSTIDLLDAYQLGWQNFGQAWGIYSNPNATIGQRSLAGAYMGAWGGMHLALVAGGTVLLWEALAPGAMSCIGNPACQAKLWQGNGQYPGVDNWKNITLPKGSTVWGGAPGQSSFYTNSGTIQSAGNDAAKIFQGLQNSIGSHSAYRPGMTQYVVTQEIQVAQSVALANPQYGVGGYTQYFIPNYNQVLQPIFSLLLTNR
jgi:RHS repeat-associated protein